MKEAAMNTEVKITARYNTHVTLTGTATDVEMAFFDSEATEPTLTAEGKKELLKQFLKDTPESDFETIEFEVLPRS